MVGDPGLVATLKATRGFLNGVPPQGKEMNSLCRKPFHGLIDIGNMVSVQSEFLGLDRETLKDNSFQMDRYFEKEGVFISGGRVSVM